MQHLEKEVREYLRASEILLAVLKGGKTLSAEEIQYIETYTMRIRSLLRDGESGKTSTEPHIKVWLKRDSSAPLG